MGDRTLPGVLILEMSSKDISAVAGNSEKEKQNE
jgi:hypothetical protein